MMTTKHRASDTEVDALHEVDKRHRLVRFNPEINSGTIIQIVVLIVGMAFGYSKIETSIALNVQRTDAIERRASEQEARTNATLGEMKSEVKDTGQKVNDLKTKIDLIDLKLTQLRK
jgi:hypothetical protein